MTALVAHVCPDHGAQSTEASAKALVWCSRPKCGKLCAPAHTNPREHLRDYNSQRR